MIERSDQIEKKDTLSSTANGFKNCLRWEQEMATLKERRDKLLEEIGLFSQLTDRCIIVLFHKNNRGIGIYRSSKRSLLWNSNCWSLKGRRIVDGLLRGNSSVICRTMRGRKSPKFKQLWVLIEPILLRQISARLLIRCKLYTFSLCWMSQFIRFAPQNLSWMNFSHAGLMPEPVSWKETTIN